MADVPTRRRVRATVAVAATVLAVAAAARAGAPETDPLRRSAVVQAVERSKPAVVNISTEEVVERRGPTSSGNPLFDQFFQDFFDARPRRFTRTSLGSGILVTADGQILTNHHVIEGATKVTVTLADEREFQARIVGTDQETDLAVLRINAGKPLPFVEMGRSDDLMIGETVIAIGNPFGLSHTVTTGVVSAVGRAIRDEQRIYTDFVQTDASINPGNSGGPLLNIRGELIAINTAIFGKAQGIGFAIPINRARRVLRDLVAYGEVKRGWVGITVQDLTPDLRQHFDVRHGVVVADVEDDSPAAAAGFERGDVIVRVDGRDVDSRDEFENLIGSKSIGDKAAVSVRREAQDQEVALTVQAFPDADAQSLAWRLLGLDVSPGRGGLVVKKVRQGSPCDRIGVEPGDAVLAFGGAAVHSVDEFRRRMVEMKRRRSVQLSIGRGPYRYDVTVPLPTS